jgi:hypothetical protein
VSVASLLRGGEPRALKGVTRVIDDVLHDPSLFGELLEATAHDDEVVRMRAGDALEKISRTNPEFLQPHATRLLELAATTQQPSLRWHLAQSISRLALSAAERRSFLTALKRYLADPSAIVKTSAMQAMADLALADSSLRRSVLPLLRNATETGTAAMRARGDRLLDALQQKGRAR